MSGTTHGRYETTLHPRTLDTAHGSAWRPPGGNVPVPARRDSASRAAARPLSRLAGTGQGRRLVWVRPSELARQATAYIVGRGIDFQAELARQARRPVARVAAASRRAVSDHARRLPPVSAFDHRDHTAPGAAHSGIGLR